MDGKEKYLYGIVNTNKKLIFPSPNATIGSATNRAIDNEGVYTIVFKDISVIVSDAEPVDSMHLLKDALANRLVEHQQVIEKVMENSDLTVIPIRLGSFAKDEKEAEHILRNAYSTVKNIFDKISDFIEIDVAVSWNDFTSALQGLKEKKEIREFKEKLSAAAKEISVDDQIKMGVMIKKALDEEREIQAEHIAVSLKPICKNIKFHQLMDDKMILNTAVLINNVECERFYEKIDELNAEFKGALDFRCVGPLPVYSFYTLEIEKMDSGKVDWARRKIGLNTVATKNEIKRAHQASALRSHPDKMPGQGAEKEFDEVTSARNILADYCHACEQTGEKEKYSFDETDLRKNMILVKVRN